VTSSAELFNLRFFTRNPKPYFASGCRFRRLWMTRTWQLLRCKLRTIECEILMNASTDNFSRTFYFGVSVEVVCGMETCSLVRYSGQDLIVDTVDLSLDQRIQPRPTRPISSEQLCLEPVRFPHPSVG
jgi:hypothetical protein